MKQATPRQKPGPKPRNKPKFNSTLTQANFAFIKQQKAQGVQNTITINTALDMLRAELGED